MVVLTIINGGEMVSTWAVEIGNACTDAGNPQASKLKELTNSSHSLRLRKPSPSRAFLQQRDKGQNSRIAKSQCREGMRRTNISAAVASIIGVVRSWRFATKLCQTGIRT